jgi:hypothetical protein
MSMLGCALGPGESWRALELSVDVVFDPETRILESGRYKTAKNYELEFNGLSIEGIGLTVEVVSPDVSTVLFDPQNPPEGYGSCHNGHCHSESGELVSYETIQLELNGASVGAVSILTKGLEGTLRIESFAEREVIGWPLLQCDDLYRVCEIDPASVIQAVGLEIASISLDIHVFHPTKLPEEGVALTKVLAINQLYEIPVDPVSGASARVLDVDWTLVPQVWDAVEFADLIDSNAESGWLETELIAALSEALGKESKLTALLADR